MKALSIIHHYLSPHPHFITLTSFTSSIDFTFFYHITVSLKWPFLLKGVLYCVRTVGHICTQKTPGWLHLQRWSQLGATKARNIQRVVYSFKQYSTTTTTYFSVTKQWNGYGLDLIIFNLNITIFKNIKVSLINAAPSPFTGVVNHGTHMYQESPTLITELETTVLQLNQKHTYWETQCP